MTVQEFVKILRDYFNDNGQYIRQEVPYGITDGINNEFFLNYFPVKKDSEFITITDVKKKVVIPKTEYTIDLSTGKITFIRKVLIEITGNENLKSKFEYMKLPEEMTVSDIFDIEVVDVDKILVKNTEYPINEDIEDVIQGCIFRITEATEIGDKITVKVNYSIPPRNSLILVDYQFLKYDDNKIVSYLKNAIMQLNLKYKKTFVIVEEVEEEEEKEEEEKEEGYFKIDDFESQFLDLDKWIYGFDVGMPIDNNISVVQENGRVFFLCDTVPQGAMTFALKNGGQLPIPVKSLPTDANFEIICDIYIDKEPEPEPEPKPEPEPEPEPETYSIYGKIVDNLDIPIESVKLELRDNGNVIMEAYTNENGDYEFLNVEGGNYILVPIKENYTFLPEYYEYLPLNENKYNQNFVGTEI